MVILEDQAPVQEAAEQESWLVGTLRRTSMQIMPRINNLAPLAMSTKVKYMTWRKSQAKQVHGTFYNGSIEHAIISGKTPHFDLAQAMANFHFIRNGIRRILHVEEIFLRPCMGNSCPSLLALYSILGWIDETGLDACQSTTKRYVYMLINMFTNHMLQMKEWLNEESQYWKTTSILFAYWQFASTWTTIIRKVNVPSSKCTA